MRWLERHPREAPDYARCPKRSSAPRELLPRFSTARPPEIAWRAAEQSLKWSPPIEEEFAPEAARVRRPCARFPATRDRRAQKPNAARHPRAGAANHKAAKKAPGLK